MEQDHPRQPPGSQRRHSSYVPPQVVVIEPSPTVESPTGNHNWRSSPSPVSHAPVSPAPRPGSEIYSSIPGSGKKPPSRLSRIIFPSSTSSVSVAASPPATEPTADKDGLDEGSAKSLVTTANPAPSRGNRGNREERTAPSGAATTTTSSTPNPEALSTISNSLASQTAINSNSTVASPAAATTSSPTIDPLSQHIILRTNTDRSLQKLRNIPPSRISDPPDGGEALLRASIAEGSIADVAKERKKGVSFLSRLSMRTGWKRGGDADDNDDESELSEQLRTDGSNARVFATIVDSGGYIPHHKEPPRYIRTKAHNKKNREFNRMFLAQELIGTRPPNDSNGNNSSNQPNSKSPVFATSVSAAATGDARNASTVTNPTSPPPLSRTSTKSNAKPSANAKTKTGGAIWAAQFSRDGRYFAAAGRDQVVRVWAVISTPDERRAYREEEEEKGAKAGSGASSECLSAPVFREKPVREFVGHSGEVLDLSWSKNNFLLSTSMDKSVRLWHMSRQECLCTFRHKEFVSRVAFHPRDDRFFLAGCLDATLRLWSIPDKAVAFSAQTTDLITAVAFSPDGKVAIAGLLSGLCNFYGTEGLKLQAQLLVRSSRGKNAKGSKITGIQTAEIAPPSSSALGTSTSRLADDASSTKDCDPANVKVLITSTDARVRIYNLRDKTLDVKFKGHEHSCGQLCANFSDDGSYVICPSEDRKTFIWSLGPGTVSGSGGNGDGGRDPSPQASASSLGGVVAIDTPKGGDKGPCESFAAHGSVVTTALFAPTRTRQLLGASGDPIYDLCNPPPVVLVSMGEAAAAEEAASAANSPHPANQKADKSHNASQTALSEVQTVASRKPEESPGYIARSTHYDGNILVTTDDTGIIKIFRQDCAFRRRREGWESTTSLGRKVVGRSGSILTRTSASSMTHSRRGSLSLSMPLASGRPSSITGVVGPAVSSDHILDWRQGVESAPNTASGRAAYSTSSSAAGTPVRTERSERSISPTKSASARGAAANLAVERRREMYLKHAGGGGGGVPISPASSTFSVNARAPRDRERGDETSSPDRRQSVTPSGIVPTEPPTPAFSFVIGDDCGIAGPRGGGGSNNASAQQLPGSDSPTPIATAGTPTPSSPTTAQHNETSGFWNLKWPRMPTLRAIGSNVTSSIPGFGPGGILSSSKSESESGGDKDFVAPVAEEIEGQPSITNLRRKSTTGSATLDAASTQDSSNQTIATPQTPTNRTDAASPSASTTDARRWPPLPQHGGTPLRGGSGGGGSGPNIAGSGSGGGGLSRLSFRPRLSTGSDMPGSFVGDTDDDSDAACRSCGGREFKAKRIGGRQRFLCARCGAAVGGVGGGGGSSEPEVDDDSSRAARRRSVGTGTGGVAAAVKR